MPWVLRIEKRAQKQIRRLPRPDRERILSALDQMLESPYGGDVLRLQGMRGDFRRRIGSYRIFFSVESAVRLVHIYAVSRRQTTTYKKA